jgi:hypothetical protein
VITELYIDDLTIDDGSHAGAYTVRMARGFMSRGPVRRDVVPRWRQHGSDDHSRYHDGRSYEIELLVRGPSDAVLEDNLDALRGMLEPEAARAVKFRRRGRSELERITAKLEVLEDDPVVGPTRIVPLTLRVFAGDPRIYSDTLRSGSYEPADAGSGRGVHFPLVFPLEFFGQSSAELVVTNAGYSPTPPVHLLTGPALNPILANETTEESLFTKDLDLAAGQTLEIDVRNRRVLVDGTLRPDLIDASRSVWWELAAGENHLRVRGGNFVDAQTVYTVNFRDARS